MTKCRKLPWVFREFIPFHLIHLKRIIYTLCLCLPLIPSLAEPVRHACTHNQTYIHTPGSVNSNLMERKLHQLHPWCCRSRCELSVNSALAETWTKEFWASLDFFLLIVCNNGHGQKLAQQNYIHSYRKTPKDSRSQEPLEESDSKGKPSSSDILIARSSGVPFLVSAFCSCVLFADFIDTVPKVRVTVKKLFFYNINVFFYQGSAA